MAWVTWRTYRGWIPGWTCYSVRVARWDTVDDGFKPVYMEDWRDPWKWWVRE